MRFLSQTRTVYEWQTDFMNNSDTEYTGSECARALKVDESTIRLWRTTYGIPSRKVGNRRLFSTSMLAVMRQIHELKKADPTVPHETIMLNIGAAVRAEVSKLMGESGTEPEQSDSVQFGYEPAIQKMQAQLSSELQLHTQALAQEFGQKIEGQSQLAQAFGDAREELGALKAENMFLRQALHEEKQKTLLLPAPEDLTLAKAEKDHLAQALAEKEAALSRELERIAALDAEKNRIVSESYEKDAALAVKQSEAEIMQAQLMAVQALANQLQAEKEGLLKAQGELSSELAQERKRTWWEKLFKK